MDLNNWCIQDERLVNSISLETYKQYAGLKFDKKIIENLSKKRIIHQKLFLKNFKEPKELYRLCVDSLAYSENSKTRMEIYELRNSYLKSDIFKLNNKPVSWNTWRQFNVLSTQEERKIILDEFLSKIGKLTPLFWQCFQKSKEIHKEYNLTPLDCYLENEKIKLKKLKSTIEYLGEKAKKPFRKSLENYSSEIMGCLAVPSDCFYFFRSVIFKPLNPLFKKYNPVLKAKKLMKELNIDTRRIKIDTENRTKKYASPVFFEIKIPDDGRVLYKSINPYTDFTSCFHEVGHAVHFTNIDKNFPYWKKYNIPTGIAETFSMFFELPLSDKSYLKKEIKLSDEQILDLKDRIRFMDLFFLVFYSANSLMKIKFLEKNLTMESADREYQRLFKKFLGFDIDGRVWQLHHVMPDNDLYSPSYTIAGIRSIELKNYLKNNFGELWWKDKNSGKFIMELAEQGSTADFSSFSSLNPKIYLKNLT